MRFICARGDIHRAVQIAGRAASSRTTLPILNHVLIHGEGESVTLTGYDQEVGIQVSVRARVEEGGECTAPAKLFGEMISDLPEAEVTISSDSKQSLSLSCLKSQYTLAGLSPDDFPRLPEVGQETRLALSVPLLREIIRQTIFCVADEDTRPALTGVHFAIKEGKVVAASTDTHRLSVREAYPSEVAGEAEVIVPQRALDQFIRAIPTGRPEAGSDSGKSATGGEEPAPDLVEFRVSRNQASLQFRDVLVVSRLIEGPFPNYERVIPPAFEKLLVLEREPLQRAVRRAAVVARNDRANRLVLRSSGEQGPETNLALSAESSGLGKAYEEIPATLSGDEVELAFNCNYLLEVLGVLEGDVVRMEVSGALTPCIIRREGEDSYRYILMPMQLA